MSSLFLYTNCCVVFNKIYFHQCESQCSIYTQKELWSRSNTEPFIEKYAIHLPDVLSGFL